MTHYRNLRDEQQRVPERDLNPPDDQGFEPDESDLKQARGELAERIAGGEKVGKLDLEACLEAENEADSVAFVGDIATLFAKLYAPYGTSSFWCACDRYIERIAAKHISDEDVMDRAVQNLNENAE